MNFLFSLAFKHFHCVPALARFFGKVAMFGHSTISANISQLVSCSYAIATMCAPVQIRGTLQYFLSMARAWTMNVLHWMGSTTRLRYIHAPWTHISGNILPAFNLSHIWFLVLGSIGVSKIRPRWPKYGQSEQNTVEHGTFVHFSGIFGLIRVVRATV